MTAKSMMRGSEMEGWSRPGFDDSGWQKAQAVKVQPGCSPRR